MKKEIIIPVSSVKIDIDDLNKVILDALKSCECILDDEFKHMQSLDKMCELFSKTLSKKIKDVKLEPTGLIADHSFEIGFKEFNPYDYVINIGIYVDGALVSDTDYDIPARLIYMYNLINTKFNDKRRDSISYQGGYQYEQYICE